MEPAVNDNNSSIRNVADSLESMNKQTEAVADKVDSVGSRVVKLEKENASLCDKYEELDSYKRRWNLRVEGVEERPNENIKQLIISLFGFDVADHLPNSINTQHRLGPRLGKRRSARQIIVQVALHFHHDKIWNDAKTSVVLQQKKSGSWKNLLKEPRM